MSREGLCPIDRRGSTQYTLKMADQPLFSNTLGDYSADNLDLFDSSELLYPGSLPGLWGKYIKMKGSEHKAN